MQPVAHYIEYGGQDASCTVVILHGWGCCGTTYDAVSQVISRGYRVLAPDLPGFGMTPEPPSAWTTDEYADWVCDFLSEHTTGDVILMGHSFGGHLTIKIAARDGLPFRLTKVILLGSTGVKHKPSLKSRASLRLYKTARAVMQTPPLRALFPNAVEDMRNRRGSADYRAASPLMRQVMVQRLGEDLQGVMPKINIPALLIWGANDTATPLSDGQQMEKLIPNAGLVTVQNAGHFAFLDSPVVFARVIESFLGLEVR